MDQELNVIVLPNGAIQQEWRSATGNLNKSTRQLQAEIHDRFLSDGDT